MIRDRFEIYAMNGGVEKRVWGGNRELDCRRLMDRLPARLGPLWGRWRVLDYGEPLPGAPPSVGQIRRKIGEDTYAFEIVIKYSATTFAAITKMTRDGRWYYHEMNYSGKSPYFATKREVMAHAIARVEAHIASFGEKES